MEGAGFEARLVVCSVQVLRIQIGMRVGSS